MLTTKRKLGSMLMLTLACAATAASSQAQAKTSDTPVAEDKQVRKDRCGDALPEGATARLGTLRLRHRGPTTSAVFTRDGKTAIVSDRVGDIVYWDVATGREVRRLRGAISPVVDALAITADGKTLASASDRSVLLWDAATGKELARAEVVRSNAIDQLLFTPDSRTLAIRNYKTILLWDVAGKKKLHEWKAHTDSMACMALSPDGKMLASGAWNDRHIRLWDIASGKEKLHFATHDNAVLNLSFSPDGKTLASNGYPTKFAFFGANTGQRLPKATDYFGSVERLTYSPDGKTLVGIGSGNTFQIFDAAGGKRLREFHVPPPHAIGHFLFSPDGKTIVAFRSGAHTIDLWDVASGKPLHVFPGHRSRINALAFSIDGQTIFSAEEGCDYSPCLWDAQTGERRGRLGDYTRDTHGLALSPDGKLLATSDGYGELTIHLWDLASRKEVRRCIGGTGIPHLLSVAWSADGRTLLAGCYGDKTIRVWDPATGKERRVIDAKQDNAEEIALSPNGAIVAVGGYADGTIHLWSAATGKELRKMATPPKELSDEFVRPERRMVYSMVYALAFRPDGSILASGAGGGEIHLWDPATGRLLRQWDTKASWIAQLAFSRDGRTLVTGHNDRTVRLWEVATGKERACFAGHRGLVRTVAFSRDDRRIASGSEDTTILVWDATGGARPDAELSGEQRRALWDDLIGTDAGLAYRASWRLALSPQRALPLLAEQLRRFARLDMARDKQVERLLADLDSGQFPVREKAEAELEKMASAVEPALRKALEGKPSLEVRRRIDKVLEKVSGWSGERLRTLRALEAIEHMNTPEAKQLLETLANGTPQAWLTEEARASRKRVER